MAAVECLWWWPLSPWLSPAAAWFIFFNAVVGAIAVMSWGQQGHAPSRRRLCRSASSMVFDRLRSFSIFPVHPAGAGYGGATATLVDVDGDVSGYYYCPREAEEAPVALVCTEVDEPPKTNPPAAAGSEAPACTAPVATAACTAEDDAASASVSDGEEDEADAKEEEEKDKSISLDEAYALVARQRAQSSTATAAAVEAAAAATTPKKRKPAKVAAGIRQRGHGCGRREAEEALEGKAELNARAELFIRQFRADLRLQRLNSILNYAQALSPRAAAEAPAAR